MHHAEATAAAISLGQRATSQLLLWMNVRVGIVATTAVVSNDKACACGLWDEHPIVVVAQRLVDWKLLAGQLNTVSGTNSMEFITHPTSTDNFNNSCQIPVIFGTVTAD